MTVQAYINFNGNCRDAVEFYAEVFKTEKPQIMLYGDTPSDEGFPLTEETKNLITAEHFKLMKKNAVLINTARGGIVNEKDLYEALLNGDIWAAGLDVFEEEPVKLDHPLLSLKNVVTLPHIGSASISTRIKMADLAATNLLMGLNGEKPLNLVNTF